MASQNNFMNMSAVEQENEDKEDSENENSQREQSFRKTAMSVQGVNIEGSWKVQSLQGSETTFNMIALCQ